MRNPSNIRRRNSVFPPPNRLSRRSGTFPDLMLCLRKCAFYYIGFHHFPQIRILNGIRNSLDGCLVPDSVIVLQSSAVISPFGGLKETVEQLSLGRRAVKPLSDFPNLPPGAPFIDPRNRDVRHAADALKCAAGIESFRDLRFPFLYCCAKGDIRALESYIRGNLGKNLVSPFLDVQAHTVASELGLTPWRILTVSNACASGALGVATAKELIEDGETDGAVLFGYDCISRFVLSGFAALNALSWTGPRPFDIDRDGLSLGEAAGVCGLRYRGAKPGDIFVAGAGSSNDANHRTGPSRTGDGLLAAARAAIEDAELSPDDIGFVKCHGTATVYNDAMEAKALSGLFGKSIPPCVSFKGAVGHTSGGGSLVEMIIAAEFLKRKSVPPTVGFGALGVDEPIPVSGDAQDFSKPAVLCLSAGFGGVNAAIVLREHI